MQVVLLFSYGEAHRARWLLLKRQPVTYNSQGEGPSPAAQATWGASRLVRGMGSKGKSRQKSLLWFLWEGRMRRSREV